MSENKAIWLTLENLRSCIQELRKNLDDMRNHVVKQNERLHKIESQVFHFHKVKEPVKE